MRTDGYVKTTIQSGAGADEWDINPLGMGVVTPYSTRGLSMPDNCNTYFCQIEGNFSPIYIKPTGAKKISLMYIYSEPYTTNIETLKIYKSIYVSTGAGGTFSVTPLDSVSPVSTVTIKQSGGYVVSGDQLLLSFYTCRSVFPLNKTESPNNMILQKCPPILNSANELFKISLSSTAMTLRIYWIEY